ncbi:hypothetical protein ACLB2K_072198 [Fragaria x ananassa]
MIKRDVQLVVNLVSKSKWKGKDKVDEGKATASSATGSREGTSGTKPFKLGPKKAVITKGKKPGVFKCFFCKNEGHMKKNCQGFKYWMAKKGKSQLSVFSIEGFPSKRAPRRNEVQLAVGNGMGRLKKFKIFIAVAEKELGKQVKAVRSNRGGEYYGRYTEIGQHKGHFALYLQEHGVQAQYTTLGSPESNEMLERKNRTLLNMVRSMMCTLGLPRFLWGEALKTSNYITNRTPSKAMAKTSLELWKNKKPRVNHVHVWGCKAEARPYNPKEGKLDPKTISAHFIGYPENSRGYGFYCPTHSTRIIEINKAVFLNEINYTHTYEDLELDFQDLTEDEPQSMVFPIDFEAAAGNVGQPQLEVVVANQNDDSENSEDDLEEVEQELELQNLQDVQVDAGAPPHQLR